MFTKRFPFFVLLTRRQHISYSGLQAGAGSPRLNTMHIVAGLIVTVLLSACSKNPDERAGKLFSYVPEDTLYLAANTEPVPEGFYKHQVQQVKAIFSDDGMGKMLEAAKKKEPGQRFFVTLMQELSMRAGAGELDQIGLDRNARTVTYAWGLAPVMRSDIRDPSAFKAMLEDVAKRSGYALDWQTCEGLDCLAFSGSGKSPLSIEMVLHPDHIAVALFLAKNRASMVAHLVGKKVPAKSYSVARFEEFQEQNHYLGAGAGFVELDGMVDRVAGRIADDLAQRGKTGEAAQVRRCAGGVKALLANMPRMIFGAKEIKEKEVRSEVVLETTPGLAKTLQDIPAKLDGLEMAANPVIDFGVGLNIPRFRDALIDLLKQVGMAAKKSGCTAIPPDAMQKASMAIAMAMGMGITQLQGLYVAVNDITLDDQMKPSKVDARFSIAADDPVGLLRMAAAFVPPLADLELPEDGKQVPLPAGVLPPGMPPVSLARKGKFLNVVVGDGDAKTVPVDAAHPALLWGTLDGPRYYGALGGLIDRVRPKLAKGKDAERSEQALVALRTVEKFVPSVSQRIHPDSRGLVMDFDIRYP